MYETGAHINLMEAVTCKRTLTLQYLDQCNIG